MAFAALDRPTVQARKSPGLAGIRRVLNTLYLWAAYLAAASMVIVLLLTLAQIFCRYASIPVRGFSDYAGYFMAASAFLAFAHALNRGSHIRIELLLGLVGRYRIYCEAISLGLGATIASWFAYHACTMVIWSYKFGDISTGLDATPLWIPQSTMAFGSVLFAIALADQWLQLMLRGKHTIPASEGGE